VGGLRAGKNFFPNNFFSWTRSIIFTYNQIKLKAMKKQIEQPINPQDFWASQMGNKPHQMKGEGPSQGPAFSDPEEEWRDGNGY
jgi:hypothetical protein